MTRVLVVTLSLAALISAGIAGTVVILLSRASHDLPEYTQLAAYEPPVVTRFQAGDGRLLAEYATERRVWVPVSAMPRRIVDAFVSAEDQNFWSHPGIDIQGIARAMVANISRLSQGRRPEGASTITQQVARNFLLSDNLSMMRKLREMILALRIERSLSKERIIELYLNEIFLGMRSYGVAAAALNYFNKSLDDLTVAEAAFLAALPKAPSNYNPSRRMEAAVGRRNWVITRMLEDRRISASEAEAARAEPITVRRRDPTEVSANAEYFAEEVRRQIVTTYGEQALYRGGLSVRTTMDPKLQVAATQALREGLMTYDRRHGYRGPVTRIDSTAPGWEGQLKAVTPPPGSEGWELALVRELSPQWADISLANGGGGRIALAELRWARRVFDHERQGPIVNRPHDTLQPGDVVLVEPLVQAAPATKEHNKEPTAYALRQVPEIQGGLVAMDPHTGRVLAMVGGFSPQISSFNRATQAWRQPGSSFKPFVYMAALEKGFTPSTLVLDAAFIYDPGYGQPLWKPENYTQRFYGPSPLRVGIEQSRNLMTVRLANEIGMQSVKAVAENFGVVDTLPLFLPNSLGATETTVMRMVTAYSMIVNGGRKINPTMIDRIQDRQGDTIFRHDTRACPGCSDSTWKEQAEPPDIRDTREQIADPRILYQMVVMLEGAVRRGTGEPSVGRHFKRPIAGKTGTSNDYKDNWFVGFSPDLAVGLYVGFDHPRSLGRNETGGSVAAPIFRDVMLTALKDAPITPFRVPPGIVLVRVDPQTGLPATPNQKGAIRDAFLPGTEPNSEANILDGSADSATWLHAERNIPATSGPNAQGNHAQVPPILGTGGLY